MSLMSFIGKQFIDILQWTEEGPGVLAWRYPMQDLEIQNGGVLVVRETQRALFVNEGKVADLFGPGTYRLTTADAADPHLSAKLGQGVRIAVQVGRVLLQHARPDRPALGHAAADHGARQGVRRAAHPRQRRLFLQARRPGGVLDQASAAPCRDTRWTTPPASCARRS